MSRHAPLRPDPMPLREALRGLRFMLRRGGETLAETITMDGWFPTRDAGYMDEDGYIFLSGRADDVIVRGGENMSITSVSSGKKASCSMPPGMTAMSPGTQSERRSPGRG